MEPTKLVITLKDGNAEVETLQSQIDKELKDETLSPLSEVITPTLGVLIKAENTVDSIPNAQHRTEAYLAIADRYLLVQRTISEYGL